MGRSPDAAGGGVVDTGTVTETDVTGLIELGRDREAAERGAGGRPMDVLSQFDEVGPLLAGVVGGITPAQLDAPTPCTEFTVRGVLEHMVGGATAFAAAFRGEDAPTPAPPTPDGAGDDVLATFGPALMSLAGAVQSPGALDRTVTTPFGDLPGATFARFVVLDGLVHGWDLAIATGQPYAPSDALVADVIAFATDALPPLRDGQAFAAATDAPPSASPIERLAALTGRQV